MDLPPKLPPKKDVLIAFLAESSVLIYLDPRRAKVQVPKWFQKQSDLVLQVGFNLPIPIPDLQIGDEAVSCTLNFSPTPVWCYIPWSAIFAIRAERDHRAMVWPDDIPRDSQLGRTTPTAPRSKPRLQAVPAHVDVTRDQSEHSIEAKSKPSKGTRKQRRVPLEQKMPSAAAQSDACSEGVLPADATTETEDSGSGKKHRRQLPPYLRVVK